MGLNAGQIVKERINSEGRTHNWVAKQLGLSKASFSQRIHGKTDFRLSEINKLEKIFPNVKKQILQETE